MSRHSARGNDWAKIRARVLARDNHTCGYCGRDATTVDHIVARANGGTDDESNLISACNPCNGRKGAKVMVRTAYHDPEWLDAI